MSETTTGWVDRDRIEFGGLLISMLAGGLYAIHAVDHPDSHLLMPVGGLIGGYTYGYLLRHQRAGGEQS